LLIAIRFRSGAHGECIWHVKNARTKSAWVSAVEFLCRFCNSSDGGSLTTEMSTWFGFKGQ
jgi:hypothetical protein